MTRSKPSAPSAKGTNGRHHEPSYRRCSNCTLQPPSKTGGAKGPVGEGITATGKPTSAPKATKPVEARRRNAGPLSPPKRDAAGHNQGTGRGAKQHSNRVPQTRDATEEGEYLSILSPQQGG